MQVSFSFSCDQPSAILQGLQSYMRLVAASANPGGMCWWPCCELKLGATSMEPGEAQQNA